MREAFLQRVLLKDLRDIYQARFSHSLSSGCPFSSSSSSSSSLFSSSSSAPFPLGCLSIVDEEHRQGKRVRSSDHRLHQETASSSSSLISREEILQLRKEEEEEKKERRQRRHGGMGDEVVVGKDVEIHARRRRKEFEGLFKRILDWFVATEILICLKRYFFFWPVVLRFLDKTDGYDEERKFFSIQAFQENSSLACMQSVKEEKRENEKARLVASEGREETFSSSHGESSFLELRRRDQRGGGER